MSALSVRAGKLKTYGATAPRPNRQSEVKGHFVLEMPYLILTCEEFFHFVRLWHALVSPAAGVD